MADSRSIEPPFVSTAGSDLPLSEVPHEVLHDGSSGRAGLAATSHDDITWPPGSADLSASGKAAAEARAQRAATHGLAAFHLSWLGVLSTGSLEFDIYPAWERRHARAGDWLGINPADLHARYMQGTAAFMLAAIYGELTRRAARHAHHPGPVERIDCPECYP